MISSGMSPFVAVDVLGDRLDLARRRSAGTCPAPARSRRRGGAGRPRRRGRRGTPGRGRSRGTDGRPASAPGSTPQSCLAAQHAGREVVDDVGDERARDAGLDVALGAVVEQRPGGLDRRRRRGRGRRQHLLVVVAPSAARLARCLLDDGLWARSTTDAAAERSAAVTRPRLVRGVRVGQIDDQARAGDPVGHVVGRECRREQEALCPVAPHVDQRASSVALSSTPSATTSRPRLWPSSMIDLTIARSLSLRVMSSTNDWSILISLIGSRRRCDIDE